MVEMLGIEPRSWNGPSWGFHIQSKPCHPHIRESLNLIAQLLVCLPSLYMRLIWEVVAKPSYLETCKQVFTPPRYTECFLLTFVYQVCGYHSTPRRLTPTPKLDRPKGSTSNKTILKSEELQAVSHENY